MTPDVVALKRYIDDLESTLENALICNYPGKGVCDACKQRIRRVLQGTANKARQRRLAQPQGESREG